MNTRSVMNENTKLALINFVEKVAQLSVAVSSFAGTHCSNQVIEASEILRKALDSDEKAGHGTL